VIPHHGTGDIHILMPGYHEYDLWSPGTDHSIVLKGNFKKERKH